MLSILLKAPASRLLFSPLAKTSCNTFLHPVPSSQRCLTVNFSNSSFTCNKVVFISQSNDVFSNLALEAWLYKNWSFDRRRLLLLWRNSPCVVIGCHQNPFKEANLSYLESAEVPLARRHSGGGAVYHDHGNLNCTFFSNRVSYNRRWNLELVCHCLRTDFSLNVQLNDRDDILIGNDLKVSGSAAKLGRETAYHHCTLLVDTEKSQLSLALRGDQSLESTATASVRSAVGSLRSAMSCTSLASPVTVSEVLQSLSSRYLEAALPGQQHDPRSHVQASHGVTLVSPQEDWFPGIDELREELTSWSWLYGKTPRFSKSVSVSIPEHLRSGAASATLLVRCERGLVQEVMLDERDPASAAASAALKRAVSGEVTVALRGTPYTSHLPDTLAALLRLPATGAHSIDKIKI